MISSYLLSMKNALSEKLKSIVLVRAVTDMSLKSAKLLVETNDFRIGGRSVIYGEKLKRIRKAVRFLDDTDVIYGLEISIDGLKLVEERRNVPNTIDL